MTLRTRLALWYSVLLMTVIVIFSIVVITVSRVTLLQTVDQVLNGVVTTVEQNIAPIPIDEFNIDGAVEIFYETEEFFNIPSISVQIWRTHENGILLDIPILERASGNISNLHTHLDPSNHLVTSHTLNSVMTHTIPERVVSLPFTRSDGVPLGVIQVGTPLTAVAQANDQLLVITLISALVCMGVSIGLGKWLSTHLLKPIGAIQEAAANVAVADDLTHRIPWDGPDDELGALTKSFNHMMGRLESVFKVQQEFIGDVSHELRTPLTSIIGHLEIMVRYGVDNDSLDALHREASRMSRMVNDLLLLTRADSGELSVDLYPLDVDAIVLDVFEQSLNLVQGRKLSIDLERIEAVRIEGNADRLRQLLLNLISNSIKFTEDDGKIKIAVYPDADDALIKVSDTGIGISGEDRKRIFDRFFQADSARVHRSESDGAGLGLSIARWIVEIHKGTIEVDSTVGTGTIFTIRIPRLKVQANSKH